VLVAVVVERFHLTQVAVELVVEVMVRQEVVVQVVLLEQ
jgi:hypothetical protein